jgi:hypothetical protein
MNREDETTQNATRQGAAFSKTTGVRSRRDSQTDSQEGEQPWTRADNSGVMNPMATARGLQLPRNDQGAASGCMTSARQNQRPAACAPSGAWSCTRGVHPSVAGGHLTLATFPASTPPNVQLARCPCCDNRSLRPWPECLEHTGSLAQQTGDGAIEDAMVGLEGW